MGLFNFGGDDRGTTAMIFALAVVPILMIVGGVVDMGHRQNKEITMQSATDAAVIAGVTSLVKTGGDKDEAAEVVKSVFAANLANSSLTFGEISPTVVFQGDSTIQVTADHYSETTLMALAGVPKLRVQVLSEASFGAPSHIEAVLVLDNSLSMKGDRIDDLKQSAQAFADTVLEEDDDTRKIGIVPFSNFVNVGTQYRDEPWLSIPKNYDVKKNQCRVNRAATIANGCRQKSRSCTRDGVKTTCKYWSCPGKKEPVEVCVDQTKRYRWHGCVNSRRSPLNIDDRSFDTDAVPGYLTTWSGGCPAPILALTEDADEISDHIDDLQARGETYMATGITWGIRVLSSSIPFDQGAVPVNGENQNKVMVILSDGENSRGAHPTNGNHWHKGKGLADNNTVAACNEAADTGIIVYAIAFDVRDAKTVQLLKDCAGDPERFFEADEAGGMLDAFQTIGTDLKNLALTK
jgi:Flp pilus assembly protein TadG